MANFCLPPNLADHFKKTIRESDIADIAQMSSDKRRAYFADLVGESNAKEVNTLFESKLVLKNKKAGLVNWVKSLTDVSAKVKSDMFSKIEKLDQTGVLDPATEKAFLQDLAEKKLGVGLSAEEAKKISTLASDIRGANKILDKGNISDFGRAKVKLENYVNSLKPEEGGFRNKFANVLSIQRAIQTGFDLSSAFRQGAPYFGRKEWFGAIYNGFKYAASQGAVDELKAKMYSNPLWDTVVNKYKNDLGLTILGQTFSTREEQFASKLIGKIPGLSNSERFYEGTLNDLRYNRFVNTINAMEKAGRPLSDEATKNLAKVISSSTGRGDLSRYGLESAANSLSTAFFAPKFAVSKIDQALDPVLRRGVRVEAAKNLATVSGLAASLMFGLKAAGVGIELDPRSTDFGKVKLGNTRVDLTFGGGQYLRLFAQLALNSTKTSNGDIVKNNTGEFGAKTSLDVISSFAKGKLSPGASLIIDFLNRSDFDGNKLGIDFKHLTGEKNINDLKRIAGMFEPLLASDTIQAYKDASGQTNDFIPHDLTDVKGAKQAAIAGGLSLIGVGASTYGNKQATIEKDFDIPSRSADFGSLLDKMVKEKTRISLPATTTEIIPRGTTDSRQMTDQELETYQEIYKKNIKSDLLLHKTLLDRLTGKKYESELTKIKTETTKKSKNELLRSMIK